MITSRTGADVRDPAEHVLLRELRRMNLDPKHFVIFGSAPLLVHGLRTDVRDLDVLARKSAWDEVAGGTRTRGDETGDPLRGFFGGRIQFSERWISGDYDTDALIDGAEVLDGLPFARLADVLRYKEKLNRPKDQDDIEALRKHLAQPVRGWTDPEAAGSPAGWSTLVDGVPGPHPTPDQLPKVLLRSH
jgi:hypothetical protein